MKTKISLLLLSIIALHASAQKRTIDVSDFSELSLGIPGILYLTQGSDEKVEIDCSDSVFEKIEFEMKGDRLHIRNENWRNGFKNSDVKVYVTMKDIEHIGVSGSGTIESTNTINTDELTLAISGSGDMELNAKAEEVSFRISGSGSIKMDGSAEQADARISGSGKVRADDFSVRIFEASISGSGNCYITASEEINAKISGSGSVYYSGDPDKLISNSSGSGKIRKN